jgi:DNA helicase-2/ATP-dependent DNA helicase PcrA
MRREALASVAVLCPDLAQATDWYQILERSQVPYIALVDDQDFSFAPGVEVTDIRSSKGLEFDYVVLVGVDLEHFPDRDEKRHMLHVGATRAAHQLWIVSTGTPSPLVPPGLPGLPGAD